MQVDKWRTRRMMLGVALIFGLPVLMAWYLFFHGDHSLLSSSNYGELIQSPFSVSELELRDYQGQKAHSKAQKWTVLYWTDSCGKTCKQTIDKIFRARMVLGKDMLRTQTWLATKHKVSNDILPSLIDKQGFDTTVMLLPQQATQLKRFGDKAILLIDPFGNVMMRYAQDASPKAINSDLKQLLKLSRMG
jgi:hypothetical protein